ncbi:hypothetical protein [Comamonas thiooxydans]|uniref:hypothetical protein n=1 Tax=Comamonas thiooxydans TaxID=363952 RepID=UPI002113A182|nr:hypothetical protein [Comamonas thiooxydans]UUE94290.1 hypothetical protein MJ608_00990 [Comamonas thiooxydans]
MSFYLSGSVTVAFEVPVYDDDGHLVRHDRHEHTFDASEFGLESGEGDGFEDGRETFQGILVAFAEDFEAQINANVVAFGSDDYFRVTGRGCQIVNDDLEYGFK